MTQTIVEVIKYSIEVVVVVAIFREIRKLDSHGKQLEKTRQEFGKIVVSALYTTTEEIMKLGVDFTKQAAEIYSLGSLRSLLDTERRLGEDQEGYESRKTQIDPQKSEYIKAIEDHVREGKPYVRVMDLLPEDSQKDTLNEIYVNLDFFRRLLGRPGVKSKDVRVYHNRQIARRNGDFHFRVSDKMLVIRAGGHGTRRVNAALVIDEASAVNTFRQYFASVIESASTIPISPTMIDELCEAARLGETARMRSMLQEGIAAKAKELAQT